MLTAQAQIVLDNFNTGTTTGSELVGSSWVGHTTPNGTTLTITGNDDNGWGVFNLTPFDASAMTYVSITGQLDNLNGASNFTIQFEDDNSATKVFSVNTSFFSGSMTTVNIETMGWTGGINPAKITGWTIGGGNIATNGPAFRMTLDNLALTTAAIPEPSTYAAIFGALALGLAAYRRRASRAA